jgi:two-component system chemotaxis response regulator CheY
MLINVITENAAAELLALIEFSQRQNALIGALYLSFSDIRLRPSENEMIPVIRPCVDGRQARLYFLDNGDVVITWHGAQKRVLEKMLAMIDEAFGNGQKVPHNYYDIQAHGEDLRLALKQKTQPAAAVKKNEVPVTAPAPIAPKPNPALSISETDIIQFRRLIPSRKARLRPEILIVEDQEFSRKILLAILENNYQVYAAPTAEDALKLYLRHAPDIVLLDIELPGMDGHQLAMLVQRLDPQSYVVMVTGNNKLDDVERARSNAAKGFIVKPYNKQKISDAVQKFMQQRKQ